MAVANLDDDDAVQLELPFDRRDDGALDGVDRVRDRLGPPRYPGGVVGRDLGIAVPLLPD